MRGLILILGFLLAFFGYPVVIAHAQIADNGCDPQYMDSLEARSWMLGQRRISQNQNLILKPDSVLEYSCFNEMLDVVGASGARLFSETTRWGSVNNFDDQSLDRALQAMAGEALIAYLSDNFMHPFINDRVSTPTGPFNPTIGDYNCQAMRYLWQNARCLNFMDEEVLENFYDFSAYSGFDPRQLPPQFANCAPDARMNNAINEAYRSSVPSAISNDRNFYTLAFDNRPILDPDRYERDPIQLGAHLDHILPGDCNNSPLIKTGVIVMREDPVSSPIGEYEEHFCTVPGCSFNESTFRCVK